MKCLLGSRHCSRHGGGHPTIRCRFSGNNTNLCAKENREGHPSCWQETSPKVEGLDKPISPHVRAVSVGWGSSVT